MDTKSGKNIETLTYKYQEEDETEFLNIVQFVLCETAGYLVVAVGSQYVDKRCRLVVYDTSKWEICAETTTSLLGKMMFSTVSSCCSYPCYILCS